MADQRIGTVFVELDLDPSRYTKGQQQLYKDATQTTLNIEDNFRKLGVKSSAEMDLMRAKITNSFDMIANSSKATANDILRAEEAKNAKLTALNEQQFGKQTSMIDGLKTHWIAASAVIYAAWSGANKVWDMAKIGAGFEEQSDMLGKLSAKYGTTADIIVSEMDRAAGFQIAKSELMSIALAGIAKGLKPEQLINLANAAETLGDTMGKTAGEALKDLTEALESGRVKGLKGYLGTTLDLKAAFGELESKMTDTEKAQAMYSMTMIAATDIQKQQGAAVESAADKIAKVEKKFDDATLAVSRWAKTLVVSIIDMPSKFDAMAGSVDLLTGETIQADMATRSLADATNKEAAAVKATIAPYQSQIDALKKQLKARKDNEEAIKDGTAEAKKAAEYYKKLEEQSVKDYLKGIDEEIEARENQLRDDVKDRKKYYDDIDKMEAESVKDYLKGIDDEIEANENFLREEWKDRKKANADRLKAERDVYSDLRGYDSQYYEASKALIDKQAKAYRDDLGIPKVAVDAWVAEEYQKAENKKLLATGTFVDGVNVGLREMERNATTFAQMGLATMTIFAKDAERQLSDNFFNIIKGRFGEVGIDWEAMWDSMLRTTTNYLAKIAVETAINYGGKAAQVGADWLFDYFMGFGEGAWNVTKDKFTTVHAGEMIIPADEAEKIRAASGPEPGETWAMSAPIDVSPEMEHAINAAAASFAGQYGRQMIGKELAGLILAGRFVNPVPSLALTILDLVRAARVGYLAYNEFVNRAETMAARTMDAWGVDSGAFARSIDFTGFAVDPSLAAFSDAITAGTYGGGAYGGGGYEYGESYGGGGWGGEGSTGGESTAGSRGGEEGAGGEGGSNWRLGGIPKGPDSGYWARLHGTEAVVPLPNGRSIPVEVKTRGRTDGAALPPVHVIFNVDGRKLGEILYHQTKAGIKIIHQRGITNV